MDWITDTNTVAGHNYKMQFLFHEVYFHGGGSRVFAVNVAGSNVVTNLDIAGMGAYLTEPLGVVLTYYFTGDGSSPIIILTASVNNALVNAMTLEDLTEPSVAPSVASPPQSLAVYAGQSAQLAAVVGGSSPKYYQWQAGANGVFTNLSGSTNASLTIAGATLLDAAEYQVIVSNAVGVATSSPPATLTVFPIPRYQLINVGVQSSLTGPAVLGLLPDYWNIVAGNNTTASNLLDVTGAATGVGISIQGVSGAGNFGVGGLTPGAQTAGLLSFYDYGQQPAVMTVTLSGLNPNSTYDLVVFSAGNQPGQSAVLTGAINGTNTLSTRASFALGDNYAQNQSAKPDSGGSLVVQIGNDPSQTPYGTFNGVQLQTTRPQSA